VPFLAFEHDTAARLFRFASLLEMLAALALAAWALSPPARVPALLFGAGALFWGFPTIKSLALGQSNGLVMLGLALGLWGISRERWGVAGIGLGVATILRVSPVLLLVYLLLRGKRKPVWWAAGTAAVTVATAAIVGRPGDLLVWLRDVTPEVSKGTMRAYNQSIVGALSRLTTGATDLFISRSPGAWYLLAYVLWAVALFGLWRLRRGKPLDLLEFGILILVAVAAGPLSWDHYATWALLTVVLMADFTRWTRLRPVEAVGLLVVLGIGFAMFHTGVQVPSPEAIRADWWMRLYTVRNVAAILMYLGVAAWLLVRSPTSDPGQPEWSDERDTPVGTALPLVAGRVH
jgi:alpha-1,2-mannosyltransferase